MTIGKGVVGFPPAPNLVSAIEALMPRHGWVLDDTVTLVAGGTQVEGRYRVWRNPAANNPAAIDWFVVLYASSDNKTFRVLLAERYDFANKRISGIATNTSTITPAADFTNPTAYALDVPTTVAGHIQFLETQPFTANTAYMVSVTASRVLISISVDLATVQVYGVGRFDSVLPATVDSGLFIGRVESSMWSTREPYATTASTNTSGGIWWQLRAEAHGQHWPQYQAVTTTPYAAWLSARAIASAVRGMHSGMIRWRIGGEMGDVATIRDPDGIERQYTYLGGEHWCRTEVL